MRQPLSKPHSRWRRAQCVTLSQTCHTPGGYLAWRPDSCHHHRKLVRSLLKCCCCRLPLPKSVSHHQTWHRGLKTNQLQQRGGSRAAPGVGFHCTQPKADLNFKRSKSDARFAANPHPPRLFLRRNEALAGRYHPPLGRDAPHRGWEVAVAELGVRTGGPWFLDVSRLDVFSCQGPFSTFFCIFFKLTRLSHKKLKRLSFSLLLSMVILRD